MSLSPSSLRVSNHNSWPAIERFECEREFIERMARHNVQQIFLTAKLTSDDADEPFNAAVGHILDCLDSLPRRPDAAYDSLYKVLDQSLNLFAKPNSARMHSMVSTLFAAHQKEWEQIATVLCSSMPQQTADYAASRILDCYVRPNPPHTDKLKQRAARSLGKRRYEDFRNKFLVPNSQDPDLYDLPYPNRRNAGRLMRLMFRQSTPVASKPSNGSQSASTLDLSVTANLLSGPTKLEALAEICLATFRHERFHGEAFSPFRSSKAKLKTYAHAYFMLISTYVLILGILEYQKKGGVTVADVLDVATQSMSRMSSFFGESLDE